MTNEDRDSAEWADRFVRGSGPTSNSADEFLKNIASQMAQRRQAEKEGIEKMLSDPEFGKQLIAALDDPDFNWAVNTFETLSPSDRLTVRRALYFGDIASGTTFKRFRVFGEGLRHNQRILEIVKPIYDPTDPKTQTLIRVSQETGITFRDELLTPRQSRLFYNPFYYEDFHKPIHNLDDLQFMILGEPHLAPEGNLQASAVLSHYTAADLKAMDPGYLMSIKTAVFTFGTPEQQDFLGRSYWSGFDPDTPIIRDAQPPTEEEGKITSMVRRQLHGTPEEKIAARKEEGEAYVARENSKKVRVDELARSLEPTLSHIPTEEEVSQLLDTRGFDEETANDLSLVGKIRGQIISIITNPTVNSIRQNHWYSDQQIQDALQANGRIDIDVQHEVFDTIKHGLVTDEAGRIIAKSKGLGLTTDLLVKTLERMGYNINDKDKKTLDLIYKHKLS